MKRFGGAILSVLFLGIAGYGYFSEAGRDSTGALVSAGEIDAFDIQLGDCFDDDDSSTLDEETEIFGVQGIPCAQPHDNEVFAIFDLKMDKFPGDDRVVDIAYEGCIDRFDSFVGRDYPSSALDVFPLYPTRASWDERGDREVICALYDMELSKLKGSMRGSGI